MSASRFIFISIILIKINVEISSFIETNCGDDINNNPPRIIKHISNNKRSLQDLNNTDINIFLDLTYIEQGIIDYNLIDYRSIIIDSFNSVVQILKSLLKVIIRNCFLIYDNDFDDFGFVDWDKEKFGLNSSKNYFSSCDFDLDLIIFSRFFNQSE